MRIKMLLLMFVAISISSCSSITQRKISSDESVPTTSQSSEATPHNKSSCPFTNLENSYNTILFNGEQAEAIALDYYNTYRSIEDKILSRPSDLTYEDNKKIDDLYKQEEKSNDIFNFSNEITTQIDEMQKERKEIFAKIEADTTKSNIEKSALYTAVASFLEPTLTFGKSLTMHLLATADCKTEDIVACNLIYISKPYIKIVQPKTANLKLDVKNVTVKQDNSPKEVREYLNFKNTFNIEKIKNFRNSLEKSIKICD